MFAESVRAALWFNPVLWVLCSRLRRESECACDDMVLRSGVPVQTYATHLVDIARACRGASTPLPALPVAGPSTLERTITMLLETDRDRRSTPVWAMSLIAAGMLFVGGVVASVGLLAQSDPGRLVGHVYDTSGAVLPGVEVVLESAQQAKWPTTTDSSGRFEFTPVGAGKYTLSVAVPGFRTLRDQFELGPASNWNRSITLQVGELEETITVTARRPAPRTPVAQSTSEPVRVGGNIKPPVKLSNTRPVYPASMRDAGLEGVVPMEALIAVDGTVSSVRVLSAQVHPEFARAAEEAVRQWRFSQTLLNGVPVEVRMMVSVRFSLTD
jgi:protein TonB